MPRRALVEKRPWLLVSLAAAIAYYVLKDAEFPGLYLLGLEGGSLLLLAGYSILRHNDADSRLLAGALAAAGIGVAAVELDVYAGALVLIFGNGLATALFLRHRRETPVLSQKLAALALVVLIPVICWSLPIDRSAALMTGIYGLFLGVMTGAAWASSFSRCRVGIGALLCAAAGILAIAGQGVLAESGMASLLSYPLFYFGHFTICIGVIGTLRGRWQRF
jgi:hypothetical protein